MSKPTDKPLHEYLDMEAYDVVSGDHYRAEVQRLRRLLERVQPELVPHYDAGQDLAEKFGLDLQRMQLIEDVREELR